MLGRAVILAAGTFLLTGAATAQTTDNAAPRGKAVAKAPAERAADVAPAEPDPLTPAEVQGPAPTAPMASETIQEPAGGTTAANPKPASAGDALAQMPAAVARDVGPDPIVVEVRSRLGAVRGREAQADAADRAALVAFYSGDAVRALWTDTGGLTPRAKLAMSEIAKADDWGLRASAFELPSLPAGEPSVQALADAEIRLGLAILKYARHARGGRVDPQSISKMLDRKPQVYEPRSLIQAVAVSRSPDAYLRGLHPKHAGFRNLQKALVAARAGTAETAVEQPAPQQTEAQPSRKGKAAARPATPATRSETIQRIVVNMERWRWMPDNLGAFHVWNNVPEQMTTVFKDGKVVFNERIVVGKPDTATPNFSANMQFVIFQPEWGVPNGIKNNEIAPLLRRASQESGGWFGSSERTPSTVLARHGLRVSMGGQLVNPDNVNWSQVDVNRFSFIQPSGPANVLGVVKFRFPNKHDVYMHDTPQKHLFSSSVRAFSHGCMRVQNPVRFAEVLLEHDKGWAADRVRGMVPRGGEVKLTTEIPVHNVYFTAVADEDGKLRTLGDLYGMDSRVASAVEGRAVAIASRGEAVTVEPAAGETVAQRVRNGERQAGQKRKGQATASSQGFNPFAGLFGN